MERELALEFGRVTEAAALAAARWVGRGDKIAADDAAVTAMRVMLDSVPIDGIVVIGEGEMDEAPMLYIDERVGTGQSPAVDIAVDPLEGTNIVAKGLTNAIAVLASAPRGTLLHVPDMYMKKIAVGPLSKGRVFLEADVKENVAEIAKATGKLISEVTAVVLDRPRHQQLIEDLRSVGARIKLITDGDISPAVASAYPHSDVDLLIGIGGAPEGVIAAAALKCLGGDFQGQLWAENQEQIERCHQMGIADVEKILSLDDLVRTEDVIFSATGITDAFMLRGVRYIGRQAITHTLVMRNQSGTVRFIEATHQLDKKPLFQNKLVQMKMK